MLLLLYKMLMFRKWTDQLNQIKESMSVSWRSGEACGGLMYGFIFVQQLLESLR